MTTLKAHNKRLGDYNEIDKFLLVPKKLWDDIGEGEIEISLNGQAVKTRVYDILCNCVTPDHHHRLVDLREAWGKMNIKEGDNVKIEK